MSTEISFQKPVIQRSKLYIDEITGFIMGVRKFGKTTLWADIIKEKFKDPSKGLLVSCGLEHGTNMIDNINTTHINTYKQMVALKKWLISEKGNEHDISMVCFDSAEEFFSIFETEIIRRSNAENPTKQVKSIKAAYSGFTNGEKECAKLVKQFLNDLYSNKIMPWMIGHTKLKSIKDKASLDEEGFQKLGSALISDYESAVADCFDIVVTGLVDREVQEVKKDDTVKRYIKESERRMYFRGNEIVDAGGRLKDLSVPEFIVFDKPNMAKDFVSIIEDALKAGRNDIDVNIEKSKSTTKKEETKTIKEESVIEEVKIDERIEDIGDVMEEFNELEDDELEEKLSIEEMVEECRKMFKSATPDIKKIVKSKLANGKLSVDMDIDILNEIYNILK